MESGRVNFLYVKDDEQGWDDFRTRALLMYTRCMYMYAWMNFHQRALVLVKVFNAPALNVNERNRGRVAMITQG